MAASCSLKCHVRNSKGEVVESNLFNELLHYTSNRGLAKQYYGVGTSEEFLEKVRDKSKFDENGEITIQSLKQHTDLKTKVEKGSLISKLNKEIGSGIYSYNEAISKVQSFNRNSQHNDEFLATLEQEEDGRYKLHIVEKNKKNQVALSNIISNRTLHDRILYYLNKAGVDVDFIEKLGREDGRYSTKNAHKNAEGLHTLIRVAKGEKVDETLAEEAGHFAIGALGNSPLVSRLMALLTPENQQKILGENSNKYLGSDSRRELAGHLVGKAIAGHIDKRAPWQNIMHRIVDKVKSIFAKISGNNIMRDRIEIERIADKIAAGFMSPKFEGTLENALEKKETLYSSVDSKNVKTFKEIASRLHLQAKEMAVIDRSLQERFKNIINQVVAGRDVSEAGILSDYVALEGIVEAITLISDLMQSEIPTLIDSIDFEDKAAFNANMVRNAKALRTLRTFTRTALSIINEVNSSTTHIRDAESLIGDLTNIQLVDSNGQRHSYDLTAITNRLDAILTGKEGLINQLKTKETQFFLRFCEDTYGGKYVERAARVLFNFKGGSLIKFVGKEKIPIADLINNMEDDVSFYDRYLASMSNNSDVIGQIADKTAKAANKWADDLTNKDWDDLRVLQERLKSLGIKDTSFFCEVSPTTGKLTGNIVSKYVYGDYEADYEEFRDECKEYFKERHPEIEQLSDFERTILWQSFFSPLRKQWHKGDGITPGNSQWSIEEGRYIPADMYLSEQYKNTIESNPKVNAWLNSYMELKRSIDSRLPDGSTIGVRMPQFKGTFMNRVRNKKMTDGTLSSFNSSIRTAINETFCESSEDTEYGSNQTYNNIEEDIFENQLAFETEKLNRLPIYGVNRLSNMDEISTDLFHSTLAYSSMANSYLAMSQIVDTFEVGAEVLNRRKIKGIYTETERKANKSNAYNRYLKFLDKQVYGISTPKLVIGRGLVVNKIAGFLSGLASKAFLGGNVAGGLVNLGTGAIEVFKESISGEHFNNKDWRKAHKMYWGSLGSNLASWWVNTGKHIKEDKVSLFIRHFNVLNSNREEYRHWETTRSRVGQFFFNESLFLPYKSGEHYMQAMSYLALANATKVYDENGYEISLYDAYSTDYIKANTNNVYDVKTLKLNGTYFRDLESLNKYRMLRAMISEIENAASVDIFGPMVSFTQEEYDYIIDKGYSLSDFEALKANLRQDMMNAQWNTMDETAFMDKAREINIRLHGIYNDQDKVAFQQSIYGNMFLSMKGYALGLMERRFGSNKKSLATGTEVEGSLRTVAKVFLSSFTDRGGWGLTCRAIMLPFGDKIKEDLLDAGFSANQFANLRRNFADGIIISTLFLLNLLTEIPPADDDDDDDTITGLTYYFASRLFREQAAYNVPLVWYEEASNIMNMISPTGISILVNLFDIASLAIGAQFTDEDNSTYYFQKGKKGLYEKGDAKWWYRVQKMIPYWRSDYVRTAPYESAKSYQYGSKIK